MNEENSSKTKERTFELLTIQTPNGEIPTAKSLKKLAEYWNSVIKNVNKSSGKIAKVLGDLNENIAQLLQKVKAQGQTLDLLVEHVREVRVKMKLLEKEVEDIHEEMEGLAAGGDNKPSLEESARDILLDGKKEGTNEE